MGINITHFTPTFYVFFFMFVPKEKMSNFWGVRIVRKDVLYVKA